MSQPLSDPRIRLAETDSAGPRRSLARLHPHLARFEVRLLLLMGLVALVHITIVGIDLYDDLHLAHRTVIIALVLELLMFGVQWWLIVEEIRRRRQAEVRAIAESEALKSALLAAVSHELRTPLASVKASVTSLLEPAIDWDEATKKELLRGIDEETDRLSGLIRNLLDLSRIEGGALIPDCQWYDVGELIENVAVRLSQRFPDREIEILVGPQPETAFIDYVQMSQVIVNLAENAAKYSDSGTAIHLGAERINGHLEIHVADHGPGIPEDLRTQVFKRFYRAHTSRPGTAGTGLGLAICKGLVEAHGGSIHVDAAPWGGADFVISLPLPAATPGGPAEDAVR